MKKIFLFLVCILFGCTPVPPPEPTNPADYGPRPEDLANQYEEKMLSEDNIMYVLMFFNDAFRTRDYDSLQICIGNIGDYSTPYADDFSRETLSDRQVIDILVPRTLTVSGIEKRCLYTTNCADYQDTSDECILARRSIKPSKINYFNYKKYIHNHAGLKTEDDFLNLYKMYRAFQENNIYNIYRTRDPEISLRGCFSKQELTQAEQIQCEKDNEQFLYDMAAGKAKKCSVKYPKQYRAWEKKSFYFRELFKFGARNLCIPDTISKYTLW